MQKNSRKNIFLIPKNLVKNRIPAGFFVFPAGILRSCRKKILQECLFQKIPAGFFHFFLRSYLNQKREKDQLCPTPVSKRWQIKKSHFQNGIFFLQEKWIFWKFETGPKCTDSGFITFFEILYVHFNDFNLMVNLKIQKMK